MDVRIVSCGGCFGGGWVDYDPNDSFYDGGVCPYCGGGGREIVQVDPIEFAEFEAAFGPDDRAEGPSN